MSPRRSGAPRIHLGMSESDLDYHIRAWSRDMGLRAIHHRISIGAESGWPDWVIIGPHGVLFREGKGARGRISDAQREVIGELQRHGLDAGYWFPANAADGSVKAELLAVSWMAGRTSLMG